MSDLIWRAVFIGVFATVVLDLWALLLNRVFGFGLPNWGLVGRWFAHLPRGTLAHADIGTAAPVQGELTIGWAAHYAVGILFAFATVLMGGRTWVQAPTILLPLIVGIVTVGCGWFILQPGMGAGMAASKKPDRARIRTLNVIGHIVFGLAMYAAALLVRP